VGRHVSAPLWVLCFVGEPVLSVALGSGELEHAVWHGTDDNATRQALLAAINETAESALKGLHTAADDAVDGDVARLQAAQNLSLEGEVSTILKGQEELLQQLAPLMEARVETVRQKLASAKLEKAQQASEVAEEAAKEVQEENEHSLAVLQQVGASLESQAHQTFNDVTSSRSSIVRRNAAASSLQSSFTAAARSANQALRGTTHTLQLMQEQARAVEQAAGLVDSSAAQTLAILAEAKRHAVNASEVALLAVNQATQNALKLQAVQVSVAEAARATTAKAQELVAKSP